MKYLIYIFVVVMIGVSWVIIITGVIDKIPSRQFTITPKEETVKIEKEKVGLITITSYNAVPEQTDAEPCISASGMDVCNTYKRICACPREYEFGTKFLIDGRVWECQDRTHIKYDGRIDLLMDDYDEAIKFGKRTLEVYIIIIN